MQALTPQQDALRVTLDWLNARNLSPEQVRTLRAMPEYPRLEDYACGMVDTACAVEDVRLACRAWMQWVLATIEML